MIEIAPGIHRAFVARERWVAAVEGFDGAAIAVEEAHVPGLEAVGMLLPDGSLAEPWVAPLLAAERALATVNAAITREGSDDATTLMWFADGEQLYRMDAAGAYRVGRGDVGAGLLAALT